MEKKLYKNTDNKILAGVLSGLAEYINLDPTIVRILYVLLAFVTELSLAVIVYIVLALVLPEKSKVQGPQGNYHTYEAGTTQGDPKKNQPPVQDVAYRENPSPDQVQYGSEDPDTKR